MQDRPVAKVLQGTSPMDCITLIILEGIHFTPKRGIPWERVPNFGYLGTSPCETPRFGPQLRKGLNFFGPKGKEPWAQQQKVGGFSITGAYPFPQIWLGVSGENFPLGGKEPPGFSNKGWVNLWSRTLLRPGGGFCERGGVNTLVLSTKGVFSNTQGWGETPLCVPPPKKGVTPRKRGRGGYPTPHQNTGPFLVFRERHKNKRGGGANIYTTHRGERD